MNRHSKGVPHARAKLTYIIAEIERKAARSDFRDWVVAELRELKDVHLWRNVEKAPSRRVSRPMTGELVKDILVTIAARPTASNKELAELFNVQAGRISEVRQGKHTHKLSETLRRALGDMKALDAPEQLSLPKVRRAA